MWSQISLHIMVEENEKIRKCHLDAYGSTTEPSHKSHHAPVPYSMHYLETEMYKYVHVDVRKWLQNIWPMNGGIWDMDLLSAVISQPVFHLECF